MDKNISYYTLNPVYKYFKESTLYLKDEPYLDIFNELRWGKVIVSKKININSKKDIDYLKNILSIKYKKIQD
tara:strand:+ start:152 stop:367 length:216 start_codon:yes stop_codon:yes gene_type:complete